MRSQKIFGEQFASQPTQDKIKLGETSQYDIKVHQLNYEQKQTVPTLQSSGFFVANKKIIISLIVGFVVISSITVGVVVGVLNKNKITPHQNDQNYVEPEPTPPGPTPPPQTITSCNDVPEQCAGVPLGVSNYIFSNYTNDDQIRSLLQVSRTLTGLSPNSTTEQLVSSYRNIMRSAECLAYTLNSTSASAYQDLISLQMTDVSAILTYITMNLAFSGEPIRLTSTNDLANTCQFNVTSPSQRRRLQSSSNCSAEATSVLLYFDGLGSSPSTIIQNLRQLERTLENHENARFDGGSVAMGAFRNVDDDNFFINLVAQYQQYQNLSGRSVSNTEDLYRGLQLILDSNTDPTRIPSRWTQEEYHEFNNYFRASTIMSFFRQQAEYNWNRHKDFIVQQIQEGKKLVMVAHGKGTLYANIIYNLLSETQKQSVSQVFIAPFASSMADNSNAYISHSNDHALSEMRRVSNSSHNFPAPLDFNENGTTFNESEDEGESHSVRGYLQYFRERIIELISQAIIRVVQPPRQLGSGPITVVLSWDSQPDLDLHIFEPNYHVYYSSRQGNNGYLDLDDTNGYGPEHYYTSCDIETGNYTFKVNYYSGSAPSSATVTVSAGAEYFSKQLVLQTARSSSGNANPQYSICTVTVSRSSRTNSYIFQITPL